MEATTETRTLTWNREASGPEAVYRSESGRFLIERVENGWCLTDTERFVGMPNPRDSRFGIVVAQYDPWIETLAHAKQVAEVWAHRSDEERGVFSNIVDASIRFTQHTGRKCELTDDRGLNLIHAAESFRDAVKTGDTVEISVRGVVLNSAITLAKIDRRA